MPPSGLFNREVEMTLQPILIGKMHRKLYEKKKIYPCDMLIKKKIKGQEIS